MNKFRLFTFITILALILSACGAPTEFEQNRSKWDEQGARHYRFDLRVGCFCPYMGEMPVTITVLGGEMASVVGSDGRPASDELLLFVENFNTIDKIFDTLDKALNGGADQVDVEYDSTYGFPTKISIDYIKMAVDDEMGFEITNFEELR
jgi:hypothetical protein